MRVSCLFHIAEPLRYGAGDDILLVADNDKMQSMSLNYFNEAFYVQE